MSDHTHTPADADAKNRLRTLARQMTGQPAAGDWDSASAEALMQVYEGHEPTVYYADPPPAPTARRSGATQGYAAPQRPSPYASAAYAHAAAAAPAVALADLAQDRAWLDGRFSDLAARLEDTMKRLDPAEQIAPLAQRLDGLEGHLRSALDDVVRKDAFAGLELQIGDVRKQLETARNKLERLDGIEAKLGALTTLAQAASDAPAAAMHVAPEYDIEAILLDAVDRTAARMAKQAPQSAPALNMDELADRTATRTAERMASAPVRSAMPEGMSELRTMMAGYVEEYRREQSQTSAALATMQEALVQLIDRIDQYDEETATEQDMASSAEPEAMPASAEQMAERFVEVSDERGTRPGRRAADLSEPAHVPAQPHLDAPEPRSQMRQPVTPQPVTTDDASPVRSPRRIATTVANPEAAVATDVAAMAAERARIAAERASQAAPRRAAVRMPEPQQPEPAQVTPDADAAAPTAKPRATRKAAAGSSNAAKRGLMVAGIAALVIGVSAFAHMFISGRMAAVPKMDDRVPAASTGPKSSPRPQTTTVTPPSLSPGATIGVPVGPEGARIVLTPPGSPAIVQPLAQPPSGDPRSQPATQRAPQPQPVPQVQPGAQPQPQPQPSTNVLPDAFKPKSVPETINDDLQSNARPPNGTVRPSPAGMSGITLDNGVMPNPAELAKRMSAPSGTAPAQGGAQPISAQPISTGPQTALQPEAPLQVDAVSRAPVEMPPASVGPTSLRMAAQQGDPGAQFEVAARFAEGKGIKQDFQQAISWYTRASQKGFVPAQYRLATLHERGLGTPADITRAKVWYRRAADQGNVKSMHNLAVLAAGPQQAEPDYPTASRWFTEAAERGLADSQFNLGVLTENGLGMQKDQAQAYKWFALAARSGDKEAARRRDQLAATFTPDQARIAEQLVANWRAKPVDMKANEPRAASMAWAAEREAAALAVAQKQAAQRPVEPAAPMPPPPPAATPPKAKAAKVTRG